MQRLALLAASVLLVALVSSCGETKKAATINATEPLIPMCGWVWPDDVLVKVLNTSWKKKSMHVKGAWMVKSYDKGKRPMFEHGTVYLISANVKPSPGIVVFAVDEKMVDTGGGFAVALSASARASSYLGDQVSPEKVGLSTNMSGYSEAYDCAKQPSIGAS